MDLAPCPACRRHVAHGTACPFCSSDEPRTTTRVNAVGRLSRAMVFGAALGAACGGKTRPAEPSKEEIHHGGGGCSDPDPKHIADLEQRKADATSEAEKEALERELEYARQPSCMPYGAPPRRRRIV